MNRVQRFGQLLTGTTLLGLALLWHLDVQAGGKGNSEDSASKVKVTAAASKIGADGKQIVNLTLVIEKPWHIYANPVGWDIMEAARTRIAVKAKEKVSADVRFPSGKVQVEGKDQYYIYEDRVVIPVQVQRVPGDASPLQITIQVNACKEENKTGVCLPKGIIEVAIP